MATRRQVRESFYTELESSVSSVAAIDAQNIGQEEPNSAEELPAIVHTDDYRPIPMNTKTAPRRIVRDSNGNVEELSFTTTMQAQFTLTIRSDDEQEKESVYEAVRSHFEDYTYRVSHFPDPSDIQTDVYRVTVEDSSSSDATEREPPSRGDALIINLHYERVKTLKKADGDFDNITDIDHKIDVGDDGTVDETYTTT